MTVLIVYATLSGHTEELSEMIKERLEKAGLEISVEEAYEAEARQFQEYDLIILGSYTWGDGDVPDDMMDLYNEIEETDLSGISFAVFGSGDTGYEHFAGAVDHLEEAVRRKGGILTADSMKADVDADSDETEELTDRFTEEILAWREKRL